jgi:asparagine synthase (glutamine-hydrolysing)
MLFGWIPADPAADAREVVPTMAEALRTTTSQRPAFWSLDGFAIGAFDLAPLDREPVDTLEPATAGRRYWLWMIGEAFDWPSHGGIEPPVGSRSVEFRSRLLDALVREGAGAIRDLDGEYQIALWDRIDRKLQVLNDRFTALPIYYANSAAGLAFAGGVRGVLVAPGVSREPDLDAIREAVTFGGFRLDRRTNIRGVAMMRGASVLSWASAAPVEQRYWHWREIPAHAAVTSDEVIEDLQGLWTSAVSRRMSGAGRPGLTLSGGLDSRAILAEGARHGSGLEAITYGVPESDDVKYARRAAQTVGAPWTFHPMYSGDWLACRTSYVQQTDGLIDLVDLMHVEAFDSVRARIDLNLSGYVGDVTAGSHYNDVVTPDDLAIALPYYGGPLGFTWEQARARASELVADLEGAAARFAIFDHKMAQAINRITLTLRPYVRVRRPFVDYRVFELAQGVSARIRGEGALRDRWLRSTYPALFRIPNQNTGVPPLTSEWRRQVTRALRFAWRRMLATAASLGAPVTVPRRSYHADDVFWRRSDARARIEDAILRRGSLSCDVFGREEVTSVVRDWFDRLQGATQVIGALYVFESYHRDLGATLHAARRAVRREERWSSLAS